MIDHSTRSGEDAVSLSSSYSLYHRRRLPPPAPTCLPKRQSRNGAIFSARGGDETCMSRRKTKRNMLNTHTPLPGARLYIAIYGSDGNS